MRKREDTIDLPSQKETKKENWTEWKRRKRVIVAKPNPPK